ncbi:MAG: single-stranded DNA-binding protein [Pseudonocardiaceae bacterium]
MPAPATTGHGTGPAAPASRDAALHLSPRAVAWLADHPHAYRFVRSVRDTLTELHRAGQCPEAINALRRILSPHQPTATGRCRTCRRWAGRRCRFPCLVWHQARVELLGHFASSSHHHQLPAQGPEPIMNGLPGITLAGILADDPALHITSGTAVTDFTIAAHDRRYDPATGHWTGNGTTLLRCSIRHHAAENVAGSLAKGDRVLVTGVLRHREGDTTDGGQRYACEVDATEVGVSLTWATVTVTKTTSPSADHGDGDKPLP